MSRTLAEVHAELSRLYAERAAIDLRIAEVQGELQGLRDGNDSGITFDVTKAQKQRRGRAIASSKAGHRDAKGGATIAQAIAADPRWGSLTKYARARLRISQSALSRYLSSDVDELDAPPEVRAAVLADFGLDASAWPKRR